MPENCLKVEPADEGAQKLSIIGLPGAAKIVFYKMQAITCPDQEAQRVDLDHQSGATNKSVLEGVKVSLCVSDSGSPHRSNLSIGKFTKVRMNHSNKMIKCAVCIVSLDIDTEIVTGSTSNDKEGRDANGTVTSCLHVPGSVISKDMQKCLSHLESGHGANTNLPKGTFVLAIIIANVLEPAVFVGGDDHMALKAGVTAGDRKNGTHRGAQCNSLPEITIHGDLDGQGDSCCNNQTVS